MSWQTPKTNWATDDGIGTADTNRWEENSAVLHKGNGQTALSTATLINISSNINKLDIGIIEETLLIPNDTVGNVGAIRYISTLGRQPGNKIWLLAPNSITGASWIQFSPDGAAAPENYAPIQTQQPQNNSAGTTLKIYSKGYMEFIFDGNAWRTHVFY